MDLIFLWYIALQNTLSFYGAAALAFCTIVVVDAVCLGRHVHTLSGSRLYVDRVSG